MRPLRTAGRYWHTLRHLRPVQIAGRAWFRLYRPRPDRRPAPGIRSVDGSWQACARQPRQFGPARFRFLGREQALDWPAGWTDPALPKLWRYNLHYFDDLAADDAAARDDWHRALIARWIADNPPGHGDGWEPYPVSLRVVNWIKRAWCGRALSDEAVHSLAVQVRWLDARLEYHLLGNHLWANAKALVFAGCFFSGEEAAGWRARGMRLLDRELREQVLADGGHFERSPMYHAIVLEDLLDLIQLERLVAGEIPPEIGRRWRETARAMLGWLDEMRHPDGDIGFFNDAVPGVAAPPCAIGEYAAMLGVEADSQSSWAAVRLLEASGYARASADRWRLLADVGAIGPDYLPGHAHADTLSFELSLDERRIVVNSGIDRYDADAERVRQRGTAAHNTVVVDGQDSSEVWSSFRVARRAHPIGLALDDSGDPVRLTCGHDGYRRLPGRVEHYRTWALSAAGLEVHDRITGAFRHAVAHFHLHPDLSAVRQDDRIVIRTGADAIVVSIDGGTGRIRTSSWHPGFGRRLENLCIEVTPHGKTVSTAFRLPGAA